MIIRPLHELCNAVTRTQKAIEQAVSSAFDGASRRLRCRIIHPTPPTGLGGLDLLASLQICSKLTAKRKGPGTLGYWRSPA